MATLAELIEKAQRKPYPLTLPDGTVVGEIGHPPLEKWQEAPTDGSMTEWLSALGVPADVAQQVGDAVKAAPLSTSDLMYQDVARHFGRVF